MKRSFVNGAFILMAAATINRIIGFVYQAAIYRLIGPEGVGLFNMVYPVYVLIIVLATAGIPLGISKLVSEEEARGNHSGSYGILWLSLLILLITGTCFTVISYLISPLLLKYVFVNKMVYPVFKCLVPGILVISVSSAFRGFFQGLMNMKPPAIGQVFEQIVRVLIGFTAATLLLPRGIQWAAMGIAAASVTGEIAGLLVMMAIFARQKSGCFRKMFLPDMKNSLTIMRNLFELCMPITLGRLAVTLMLSIDAVLIPYILKRVGYTTPAATAVYGQLTGVAMTLLFIPSVITVSLATSLVPAISEAVAQNRPALVISRTSEAVRVTLLSGVPFITAFLVLPDHITQAIFGSSNAGDLLRVLALGGLLAYLQQTTTGVLQGLGLPAVPLKNMVIGGALKILTIYFLTAMPGLEIIGCGYAYGIFYLTTAGLNLVMLYKTTGYHLSARNDIVKPVLAGVFTSVLYLQIYRWSFLVSRNNAVSIAATLALGFLCYLIITVWLGVIRKSDLNRFPLLRNLIHRIS